MILGNLNSEAIYTKVFVNAANLLNIAAYNKMYDAMYLTTSYSEVRTPALRRLRHRVEDCVFLHLTPAVEDRLKKYAFEQTTQD